MIYKLKETEQPGNSSISTEISWDTLDDKQLIIDALNRVKQMINNWV